MRKGQKCSEETLKKMSKAKSGCNNPFYGKHLSEETKLKISGSLNGIKRSDNTRQKMSAAQKGHKNGVGRYVSDDTREKISKALKGRIVSKETREKLSISVWRYHAIKRCEETKARLENEGLI